MYEHDFCEYAVEKKKSGAYLVKTAAAVLALLALVIVAFTVIVPLFGMGVGLIALVLIGAAVWYLSRFLTIEYEYTQTGSTIDFAAVYSKQYRKEKLSLDIKKSASKVAPVKDVPELKNISKIYDFRSSENIDNGYAILFDEGGAKCAVLFDATKRIITNLRHAFPSAVTVAENLPEE